VAESTKRQRIEEAREDARRQRERREARQRRLRVLVPVLVSVAVLVVVGAIVAAIALQPKAPTGKVVQPRNLASDGIVLVGEGGKVVAKTGAARTGSDPVATTWNDDLDHYVTYVDWSCSNCKAFEAQYSDELLKQVAAGKATLEVHNVAILDRLYQQTKYSSRVNTAAVCIADSAPQSFLDAQAAMFAAQPSEQSTGLTNTQIVSTLKDAGVDPPGLASCLDSGRFTPWLTAATTRAAGDQDLIVPGSQGFGTPAIVLNGRLWALGAESWSSFVAAATKH
jgi:protein-disulfide isomerase